MARITLPTGGAFEYDWTGLGSCSVQGPFGQYGTNAAVLRRVQTRRVCSAVDAQTPACTSIEEVDNFGAPLSAFDANQIASSTTAQISYASYNSASDHAKSRTEIHAYTGGPTNALARKQLAPILWSEGKETEVDVKDGAAVLKTIKNVWGARDPALAWTDSQINISSSPDNPFLCQTNTSIDGGLESGQIFLFDRDAANNYLPGRYSNRTDLYEFDFGAAPSAGTTCPAAPGTAVSLSGYLRHTHWTYKASEYDTTTNVYLLQLPTEEQVTDSAGIQIQDTLMSYDDTTPLTYTDESSDQLLQTADPSLPYYLKLPDPLKRGNLTTLQRWRDLPSTKYLKQTHTYDEVGNVRSINPPKAYTANPNSADPSYTRTYSYTDSFKDSDGNAMPTLLAGNKQSYAFMTSYTAGGLSSSISYDYYLGRPSRFLDPANVLTKYDYNEQLNLDRLTLVRRADGGQTSYAYANGTGSTTITATTSLTGNNSVCTPNQSVIHETVFDGLGRQIKAILHESGSNVNTTETKYDGLGRKYQISNPYRTGDGPIYTTTSYDVLDRVSNVKTETDGAMKSWLYSSSGAKSRVVVTDEALKSRTLYSDAFNRLTQVTEQLPDPQTGATVSKDTYYKYDANDNLHLVCQSGSIAIDGETCSNGLGRTFNYDSLKRLLSARNPENGTLSYAYDDNGNLSSKSDARGITTCYGLFSGSCDGSGYDVLDRLRTKSYSDTNPNTASVSYTFHPTTGRLTTISSSASTTGFTGFDAVGHVTASRQTTNSVQYNFSYAYNLAGDVETEIYPSLRTLRTCYDSGGRAQSVANVVSSIATPYAAVTDGTDPGSQPLVTITGFAPSGAIQRLAFHNGLVESRLLNTRLQPTSITAAKTNGTSYDPRLKLTFSYEPTANHNNGDVLTATIVNSGTGLNATQAFTYDSADRLWTAQETQPASGGGTQTNWSQAFSYDWFGNRAVSGTVPGQSVYSTPQALTTYNQQNQSGQWDNRWMGAGVGYDAAGNQNAMPSRAFTYDEENRLITSTQPNMGAISYTYDGDGRRVMKLVCSPSASPCTAATQTASVTVYVYDVLGQLAAEYGPVTDSGTRYLTADQLGSTRLVTDETGAVKNCYDYFPFGEDIQSNIGARSSNPNCFGSDSYPSNPDSLNQKFTGKERDAETGLDFFGARYFSSAQGRFTSPDWSAFPQPVPYADLTNPQSLNLYNYMRNNPLNGTDPDGHCGLDFKCWSQFGSGVADTTYRPIVQAVSHPIDILGALGNAALHPVDTVVAVKNAVVETTSAALSGDPKDLLQMRISEIEAPGMPSHHAARPNSRLMNPTCPAMSPFASHLT